MKSIFIENQAHEIFFNDPKSYLYEERCLPMVEQGNIVITSVPLNLKYIEYLNSIGLNNNYLSFSPNEIKEDLATSILCDKTLLEKIKKHTDDPSFWKIETFIPNRNLKEISKELNIEISFPFDIYDKYSFKSGFIEFANSVGLPIPKSIIITKEELIKGIDFLKKNNAVIVKYDNTIGGTQTAFRGMGGATSKLSASVADSAVAASASSADFFSTGGKGLDKRDEA